jgi:hypothetical protein
LTDFEGQLYGVLKPQPVTRRSGPFPDFKADPQSRKNMTRRLPPSVVRLVVPLTTLAANVFSDHLRDSTWLPNLKSLRITFDDEGEPAHPVDAHIKAKPASDGDWSASRRRKLQKAATKRGVELELVPYAMKKWVRRKGEWVIRRHFEASDGESDGEGNVESEEESDWDENDSEESDGTSSGPSE